MTCEEDSAKPSPEQPIFLVLPHSGQGLKNVCSVAYWMILPQVFGLFFLSFWDPFRNFCCSATYQVYTNSYLLLWSGERPVQQSNGQSKFKSLFQLMFNYLYKVKRVQQERLRKLLFRIRDNLAARILPEMQDSDIQTSCRTEAWNVDSRVISVLTTGGHLGGVRIFLFFDVFQVSPWIWEPFLGKCFVRTRKYLLKVLVSTEYNL